jgi:hypothetical protein
MDMTRKKTRRMEEAGSPSTMLALKYRPAANAIGSGEAVNKDFGGVKSPPTLVCTG